MPSATITPPAQHTITPADAMFDAVFERSSNFRIQMEWDAALDFIRRIECWNDFEANTVIDSLERVDALIPRSWYSARNPNNGQRTFHISIGREGSPVIYLDKFETPHFGSSPMTQETMQAICREMKTSASADEATYEHHKVFANSRRIQFRFWWD